MYFFCTRLFKILYYNVLFNNYRVRLCEPRRPGSGHGAREEATRGHFRTAHVGETLRGQPQDGEGAVLRSDGGPGRSHRGGEEQGLRQLGRADQVQQRASQRLPRSIADVRSGRPLHRRRPHDTDSSPDAIHPMVWLSTQCMHSPTAEELRS